MHVNGVLLDLKLLLQIVFILFIIASTLLYLVKSTASKYFEVDANFEGVGRGSDRVTNTMPGIQIEDRFFCAVCDSTASKWCSRCKSIRYCSLTCQAKDWNSGNKRRCNETATSNDRIKIARNLDESSGDTLDPAYNSNKQNSNNRSTASYEVVPPNSARPKKKSNASSRVDLSKSMSLLGSAVNNPIPSSSKQAPESCPTVGQNNNNKSTTSYETVPPDSSAQPKKKSNNRSLLGPIPSSSKQAPNSCLTVGQNSNNRSTASYKNVPPSLAPPKKKSNANSRVDLSKSISLLGPIPSSSKQAPESCPTVGQNSNNRSTASYKNVPPNSAPPKKKSIANSRVDLSKSISLLGPIPSSSKQAPELCPTVGWTE